MALASWKRHRLGASDEGDLNDVLETVSAVGGNERHADMSKSRKLGFTDYQATDDAFYDLFARLRASHVIQDRPSP